jgi:diguanylate cyclase (GGDEF)-like protein
MSLTEKRISDFMIKDVITIPYNISISEAGNLMMRSRIGSLIVMKKNVPIGILTEREFVKLVSNDFTKSAGLIVDDIIGHNLITGTPSMTFSKAFSILNTYNIKRLPVVRNSKLVGLVTLRHLLVYSRNFLIDMLEKNRSLEKEANKDELTKVYNKRFLLRHLNFEFNRAKKYGVRVCLIFFDIDFFKSINDTYSHVAGDYVLRALGKIFKKSIRSSDVVARFGGEEFVIVASSTKTYEACRLANKLRMAVKEFPFKYRKNAFNLTISAGVASFSSISSVRQALERADKALYYAKQTGRDKVCRWKSSTRTIIDAPFTRRRLPTKKMD